MIGKSAKKDYSIPRYAREGITMSVIMDGQTYYRTAEVCRMVGISRNTLFRWLKQGLLGQYERRDRNGWRLFMEDEIHSLRAKASRITINMASG